MIPKWVNAENVTNDFSDKYVRKIAAYHKDFSTHPVVFLFGIHFGPAGKNWNMRYNVMRCEWLQNRLDSEKLLLHVRLETFAWQESSTFIWELV